MVAENTASRIPTSGYTGDNVYGVNLNGDYDHESDDGPAEADDAVVGFIAGDVGGLEFPALVGCGESDLRPRAVTGFGGWWVFVTVWENSETMDGGSWEHVSYDLTAQAAGQDDVRIRWTLGSSDSSWQCAGWNLDDVVIEGAFPCGGTPGGLFGDGFEMGDCTMWSSAIEGP